MKDLSGKIIKGLLKFAVIIFVIVLILSLLKLKFPGLPGFKMDFLKNKEGEVTTVTESSIREVFEISELQTASFIYNSIVQVNTDDDKKVKYYVSYKGTVVAGIDFNAIGIDVNDEEKKITITLPDVTIQDTLVDSTSLEYIFGDKKYNNETVVAESYTKCQEDLKQKAENESEIKRLAKDNAKNIVEGLMTPWSNHMNGDYTVEIIQGE